MLIAAVIAGLLVVILALSAIRIWVNLQVAIRDYHHAVLRIAQTTLRATIGQHELDDLLAHQSTINEELRETIAAATEPWGVQTLAEVATEHNSTLVLPIPMDMLDAVRPNGHPSHEDLHVPIERD